MPNMLLAPVPSAQYAIKNAAKSITASIYVTRPSQPPRAESIPYFEKITHEEGIACSH